MSVTVLGACPERGAPPPIPLFVEGVSAGFPSPARDYVDRSLDLNELCIRHPAATYFVRADGDSMIGAGIFSGDILIVDRSLEAADGDIIIACLHGELLVKRLRLQGQVRLEAMNPDYPPLELHDESELEVFGVVIHSIRCFR
ncbi:translesion error-prone DNA polymerase V autoproteolytic subunit [Desulfurispirillum indicum]|nr:translesion error-prone DNA polymerase V autoproteolytic subunit [Desulfurispirillum indicum]UCZ55978.1 translesion error-prone DNA polymerase V autoproteolytic subunit [Desulfurispirillum indicum]